MTWALTDVRRFNHVLGKLIVRKEDDTHVRMRMFPTEMHSNLMDRVHGGVTLTLSDIALFSGARLLCGANVEHGVTLDLTCQFLGGGELNKPLDVVVELLRETGRLVFLRGLIVQGAADEHKIAAFSGTIRKPSPPKT